MNSWKSEILEKWQSLNLKSFFDQIGIDFHKNFVTALEGHSGDNPFNNHSWQLLDNSVVTEGVLHLVPIATQDRELLWEEWFLYQGVIRHHVLSQKTQSQSEGNWRGNSDDKDHPPQVLNLEWSYFNDLDLRPLGLR